MKKLRNGFTLIKLLVVIAIIGILATTLAPKLREQLAKAKDAKAFALLGSARTGAEIILVDKVVQDTTGEITISLEEIKDKLDNKSKDMIRDSDGIIPIGGARNTSTSTVTYNPEIILLSTSDIDTRKMFNSIDTTMTVADENINLYLQSFDSRKSYSTEGKLWTAY